MQADLFQNQPAAMRPMPEGQATPFPPDSARPARNASTGHESSNTQRESRGLNRGVNAGNEGVARGGLRESPCEVPKRNRAGPMTSSDEAPGTPPSRGRGMRSTSRDALTEHRETGKLGAQQQAVFSVLTRTGQAFTRAELAKRTGIRLSAICGRSRELLDLQLIKEGPRRQCSVTGKNAHVLEAA